MEINKTSFGQIIIDLRKYDYDVWIFPDDTVKRRTSDHEFTREEFELMAQKSPEIIVIGTGQSGLVKVLDETKNAARDKKIRLMIGKTPDIVKVFNDLKKEKKRIAAVVHVTC